jgi:hypothetical protein
MAKWKKNIAIEDLLNDEEDKDSEYDEEWFKQSDWWKESDTDSDKNSWEGEEKDNKATEYKASQSREEGIVGHCKKITKELRESLEAKFPTPKTKNSFMQQEYEKDAEKCAVPRDHDSVVKKI